MRLSFETTQFCLRTGFGELMIFFGSTEDALTISLDQGSGLASPAFSILISIIVNAYKRLGHGTVLTSTYMTCLCVMTTVIYIDNTDLLHLVPDPATTNEEVIDLV